MSISTYDLIKKGHRNKKAFYVEYRIKKAIKQRTPVQDPEEILAAGRERNFKNSGCPYRAPEEIQAAEPTGFSLLTKGPGRAGAEL